ncbi:MAG TPA: hypothetical protein VF593_12100 [Chthoniobacteraceae bacterium]|jgi:hypothetical protein
MIKHSIAKFFVLTASIAAVPALSMAGTETADSKQAKQIVEKTKESCITGDLGINVVSQYVSRGVIFENQGGIIQPYADLYFKLFEGEGGFINKVSLNLGIWNSFHSRKTDAGLATGFPGGDSTQRNSSTRSWYEFDFTAGIAITFAKNFTITPSYYTFLSPNDGFSTFHGVNTKLAYDDTDLLGAFALHPYVQVLWEAENKAGTGKDEGFYYEVGIAPSVPVGPLTLTFPITAGFGSHDFYGSFNEDTGLIDDEAFGFVSGGVTASYALAFIPECYGTWTVTGGYTFYHLGEGTEDFNTRGRGGAVRDEKESEHVFSGGLMVAF